MILQILYGMASVLLALLTSACVVGAMARHFKPRDDQLVALWVMGLGIGPMFCAWSLKLWLWVAPGLPNLVYLLLVSGTLVGALVYGWPAIVQMLRQVRGWTSGVGAFDLWKRWPELVPLLFAVGILAVLFLNCVLTPLIANDPLDYAVIAKHLLRDRDLNVYPLNEGDPESGYYLPITHPLGYPLMMMWTFLVQASDGHTTMLRALAPFYTACTMALIWFALRRRDTWCRSFGVLIYASTPLIAAMTDVCHIDPLRLHFFFGAFVALAVLLEEETPVAMGLLTAYVCGAMFTHSVGLLCPFFAIPIYLFASRSSLRRRLATTAMVTGITLLVVGDRYVYNVRTYGSPISNTLPVWEMTQVDYASHLKVSRGLDTERREVIYGCFKGFTRPQSFGYSYWLMVPGAILIWMRRKHSTERVLFGGFACFSLLLLGLYCMGSVSSIMNDRYQLTTQPFVACIAAIPFRRDED